MRQDHLLSELKSIGFALCALALIGPRAAAAQVADPALPVVALPPPEPPPVDVVVRGRRVAPPRAASDFVLDRQLLTAAPHQSAGDLLKAAPGVYVSRPEGDAVAHQIFLRGFDAEHGQDIEVTAGPIPINQPSHIHGQGYADLNFIIPEVVRGLRVTEGVYDPRQGDFAVAGSVDFDLGVPERGYLLRSSYGSFGTSRQVAVFAPPGEADETFGAVAFRTSAGFGQNRGSQAASTMGQYAFRGPAGFGGLLHFSAHGSRANLAGVLRRDDVEAGRVSFYDAYADPSATSQSALGTRTQVALTMERLGDEGARTFIAVYAVGTAFRLRENFTGYLERSRERLDWIGRGDLIEQSNQARTLGGRMGHKIRTFDSLSWMKATGEFGLSFRSDSTDQTQNLIKAPQNETWDHRVDATIIGADIGAYVDADLKLGRRIDLRGGYRADALYFDVNDRLGNFTPLVQRSTHLPGFRRTALGIASGPRASLELKTWSWLTLMGAYGEGYRSPQARQLEEGENAPYTKVHSSELGARARFYDGRLALTGAAYLTSLSEDLAFDPQNGSLGRIGPSTRKGLVGHVIVRPRPYFLASVSVTSVKASLDAPPLPTAEVPTPAYQKGESLPYVPPLVVRADVAANGTIWTFANRWPRLQGRAGAGFTYLSRRPLPYGQSTDRLVLLDVSGSLQRGPFELGIEVWNLLDRRYAANEFSFVSNWGRQELPSLVPARHMSAGAPRTLLGTVTVRF